MRAAKWDGVYPLSRDDLNPLTPRDFRDIVAFISDHRDSDSTGAFDYLHSGGTREMTKGEAAELSGLTRSRG